MIEPFRQKLSWQCTKTASAVKPPSIRRNWQHLSGTDMYLARQQLHAFTTCTLIMWTRAVAPNWLPDICTFRNGGKHRHKATDAFIVPADLCEFSCNMTNTPNHPDRELKTSDDSRYSIVWLESLRREDTLFILFLRRTKNDRTNLKYRSVNPCTS